MGLFKKKVIKEIHGGTWGHLVTEHKVNVDTIANELRCVESEGVLDGKGKGSSIIYYLDNLIPILLVFCKS